MKKKILTVFIFIIMFGIVGCSLKSEEINKEDNKYNEKNNISLSIKDNTLSFSGMTLIIKNNSNQTYYYGPQYLLEKYENGAFKTYKPKKDLTWNDILYHVNANEERVEEIEWIYDYGKLQSGKYRLVRYFTAEENLILSSNVQEEFYIEFEIK